MNKRLMRFMVVLITVTFILPTIFPIYAKETKEPASDNEVEIISNPFPRINMHSNSYIQLNEVQMLPNNEGNLVSFSIDFYNGESRELSFIDYWANLRTKSGSVYSVDLIEQDQNINRISPNTSRGITFYANVHKDVQLHDLVIEFIYWDFSLPNYERVLGTIPIPEEYDPKVPIGLAKPLFVGSTQLDTHIERFQLQGSGNRQSATVQVSMLNSGARSVTLPEYQFYIQTDEGLLYGLNSSNSGGEMIIQPKETERFQLQGTLPESAVSETWSLVMTQTDGLEGDAERPIAFFALEEQITDEGTVPAQQSRTIDVNGSPIETTLKEMVRYERNDRWQVELEFHVQNNGDETVTLPEYQYIIRTSEGIRYPLTSNVESVQLDPRVDEDIKLNGAVPTSVEADGWQLVLEEKNENSEFAFLVATYEMPQAQDRETAGIPIGEKYEFGTADGDYTLELTSLQRLPWGQDDILSAEIFIHNRDQKSLPIPQIKGWFELDGVSLADDEVREVRLDRILALRPNEKTRIILFSKFPYTYEFDEVALILEEERTNDSDSFTVALADFVARSNQLALPKLAQDEKLQIETIGSRATVGIREVHTYSDSHSRLFYMEVEVENGERRQTALPNLAGYLKTVDGSYFPVTIQDTENLVITPSGKALLAAHVQVPYGVYTSNAKLVLGEQIELDGDSAFVAASEMEMPSEVRKTQETMENIAIYPYNISFSRFRVSMSSSSATLSFHYELNKSRNYQILPEGHKLVMELVDDETPYEQTFAFEEDLKIGNHTGQMTANINIGDVSEKLSEGTNFWVKVYDEYEGYRKLLATQRVIHVVRN